MQAQFIKIKIVLYDHTQYIFKTLGTFFINTLETTTEMAITVCTNLFGHLVCQLFKLIKNVTSITIAEFSKKSTLENQLCGSVFVFEITSHHFYINSN